MTTTWKTEFSDFDDMPDIPADWTDISWHNDTCPSFEFGRLRIFVDYADPDQREVATPFRFGVTTDDNDGNSVFLLDSDDWSEILAFVAANSHMPRNDAIALATEELDKACDDFSFGKPSENDVLRYAKSIAEQIFLKRRVLLGVKQDNDGNVIFE